MIQLNKFTNNTNHSNMDKVFYPELSYRIAGILYEVYNELGYGYQERYYQRAVKKLLENNKLKFQKELSCPLSIKGNKIGRY